MPKIVPPPDPTAKEEPGAQIARWLGPVGGGFVLLLSVLMVVGFDGGDGRSFILFEP